MKREPVRLPGPPEYDSGEYFADPLRHSADAAFKASTFLTVLSRTLTPMNTMITSYADVGSGSGTAARLVARGLRERGFPLARARGFDVSPHVRALAPQDGVEYVHADFATSAEHADLVTLFDVVEHVPDPISFVKAIAERSRIIGLHLPLDDSINAAFRDLFRVKVKDPGHLIFMDGVSALNLLACAGLRVVDYEYTMAFQAPSGRSSGAARLVNPLRALLARISPWLLSKTLGGASLMVIALTPLGLRAMPKPDGEAARS